MKLVAFYTLVLLAGVLSMGFQIVASRELSPIFGSSIIVWSFLISTFLVAFSLGSFIGGLFCHPDRHVPVSVWATLSAIAVSGFAVNTFLRDQILTLVERNIESLNVGVACACVVLFLPPVLALSSLHPLAVQLHAQLTGKASGRSSGTVYGMSTLGNIAGVMLTALVLVPNIAVSTILYLWLLFALALAACLCWLAAASRS
jgi:hypothetical protein